MWQLRKSAWAVMALGVSAVLAGIPGSEMAFARNYDKQSVIQTVKPWYEANNIPYGAPIFIRIFKASAQLELWARGKDKKYVLLQTYPICNFSGYLGPKLKEGDFQSPEGFYSVRRGAMNPNSTYHLSFNLGFPNRYDRSRRRTGSYLMVHGNCVSIGCYAMTDEKIEQIYSVAQAAFRNGQRAFPVHAFPFRMTDENMQAHANSPWISFWQNLKEGYDYFERYKQVPKISVSSKKYVISKKL